VLFRYDVDFSGYSCALIPGLAEKNQTTLPVYKSAGGVQVPGIDRICRVIATVAALVSGGLLSDKSTNRK